MSLGIQELQELVKTVRTRRVVGHARGDSDDGIMPIYNIPERLEAANKLANTGATEALAAIQDFFVESLLNLNLYYDTDPGRFHHLAYPSDLRYLAKALLSLGGAEAFNKMIKTKAIPALEAKAVNDCRFIEESFSRAIHYRTLSFLRTEFGSIGDWEGASKLVKEENKRREEEAKERAVWLAEEDQRSTIRRKRRLRGECTMCGRPLAFIDRLLNREKHKGCTFFTA